MQRRSKKIVAEDTGYREDIHQLLDEIPVPEDDDISLDSAFDRSHSQLDGNSYADLDAAHQTQRTSPAKTVNSSQEG